MSTKCNCVMKRDMTKIKADEQLLFLLDGRVYSVRLAKESEIEEALRR